MQTSRSRNTKSRKTFVVRLIETDDGEWAGIVSHVQSGRQRAFRRFTEVVRFIDEVVAGDENAQGIGESRCE